MRTATAALLGALFLLVMLPPGVAAQEGAAAEAARETSVVTFYGHVFGSGLGAPMPTNTQFPSGEDNLGLGVYHACADAVPGAECTADTNNKLVLFSTAGLVDVKSRTEFNTEGGYTRFHNERGSTKDVVLDTAKDVTAQLYMSVDAHAWSVGGGETNCSPAQTPRDVGCPYPYWGWDPGFWPAWTVEATLYYAVLGEHGSSADEAPDVQPSLADGSAVVVATGRSEPRDVMNGLPGQPNVNVFDVNLGKPQVAIVPKEANFFVVFSWYSDLVTPSATLQWRLWTGEFFPASFTLPVKNAFDVEYVVPQFVHDRLAVLGVLNTPWGSYDVDADAIRLDVTNARGEPVTPQRVATFLDGSVAHGAHYKPVNVTYVWDYRADGLAPGVYTLSVSAANRQGSAAAACQATVEIRADLTGGAVTPGRCGLASVDESTLAPVAPPPPQGDASADGTPGRAPPLPVLLPLAAFLVGRRRS